MEITQENFDSLKRDIEELKLDREKNKNRLELILNVLRLMKKSMDENNHEIANAINDIYNNYVPKTVNALTLIYERVRNLEKAFDTVALYLKMTLDDDISFDDNNNDIKDILKDMKPKFEINDILDKISIVGGIENLSTEEKEFLFNNEN